MSRAYRISVRESLRKVVVGRDHVSTQLEILELLPREQMAALLAEELKGRGFVKQGDVHVRETDGVSITINSETGEVAVAGQVAQQLELHSDKVGWADRDGGRLQKAQVKDQLRKQAQEELSRRADEQAAALKTRATAKLEAALGDVRAELDGVVNRVTATALKTKAAQLGEIRQITEDPNSGSMTIVLEV